MAVIQVILNDIKCPLLDPKFFFLAKINNWENKLVNSLCFDAYIFLVGRCDDVLERVMKQLKYAVNPYNRYVTF